MDRNLPRGLMRPLDASPGKWTARGGMVTGVTAHGLPGHDLPMRILPASLGFASATEPDILYAGSHGALAAERGRTPAKDDERRGERGNNALLRLWLSCADGSLYTGMTGDLERRLAEHWAGRGAHWTARRRLVELVFSIEDLGYRAAREVERYVKSLSRVRKEALVERELGMLAEYERARERYEQALPTYEEIGDRLGQANAIKRLGDVCAGEEDYSGALAHYQDAERLYDELGLLNAQAGALSQMASAYKRLEDRERCLDAYTRAIELAPWNAMWVRNRCWAYIKFKDALSARADLERAAELQPGHPYLHLCRGNLALLERDAETALAEYRAFADVFPRNNGGHFGLALASLLHGDPAQARAHYQRALELTYDRYDVEEALADLRDLLDERPDRAGGDEMVALLEDWLD